MNGSLYQDLGVSPNASPEEIARAGKAAVRKHHPDAGGDPEKFDATMKALVILRDPEKRERYDRTGETSEPEGLLEAEAREVVIQTIVNMLRDPGLDLRRVNIVVQAAAQITEGRRRHEQNMRATEQSIVRLEDGRRRLKRKNPDGDDALDNMVNHLIQQMRGSVANAQRNLMVAARALEIVADYEYVVDMTPPAGWTTTSQTALDMKTIRSFFTNPGSVG